MRKERGEMKDVDVCNYVKYVLEKGLVFEKRDLLSCIKSSASIKEKTVCIH